MSALRIDRDGDALRLTLARPETRNAFDAALTRSSQRRSSTWDELAPSCRGRRLELLRRGDIAWMRASADLDLEANVADANAMRQMSKRSTAALPRRGGRAGHVLGGGIGLLPVRIVTRRWDGVRVLRGELGIVPAVISPFALRRIGESAARRYFVTESARRQRPRCASASSTR